MSGANNHETLLNEAAGEIERLTCELASVTADYEKSVENLDHAMDGEVKRLKGRLAPFAAVIAGLPDNWPGECRLRIDRRNDGSEYLAYHGEPEKHLGRLPTITQWREAAETAKGTQ